MNIRTAFFYRPLAIGLALMLLPRAPLVGPLSMVSEAAAQVVLCSPSANRIFQARCGATGTDPSDFEREVVHAYLRAHQIPLSDEPLVYQHGKKELRNTIRALMLVRMQGNINAANRTADETSMYNWLRQKVWDNEKALYSHAVANYKAWNANPCTWKVDRDVAEQYGLNYDSAYFCSGRGLLDTLTLPPSVPTKDYYLAAALKATYGAPFHDPAASQVLTDTAARVGMAAGISAAAGVAAVAAWVTVVLTVAAVAKAIFPFASAGVATFSAAAGPAGIVLFALVIGITAGIQAVEADKVQKDLADLEALLAKVNSTPPDLKALSQNAAGMHKLNQTLQAYTLPAFESTATPPAHGAGDAKFVVTPRGGFANPASASFSYRDWDNAAWGATSAGAWLVHVKGSYSTMTPVFRYLGWNGQKYYASRTGPNFLITKANPASSDVTCAANALTGLSTASNPSACRTLVAPEVQLKDGAGNDVTVRMAELPQFTSVNRVAFTTGVAKTFEVVTSGAPAANVSFSGSLPSGVTFAPAGAGRVQLQFSGTGPVGTYPLTLTAQNAQGSTTQNFELVIGSTLQITSPAKATFKAYEYGSFLFTTSGSAPVHFTIEVPVPHGLTLTNHGDGTATLAGIALGGGGSCSGPNRPCGLIASNAVSTVYQQFSIEVQSQPAVSFSPSTVTFKAGSPNAVLLTASRNSPAVRFSIPCTNPPWLGLTDNGDGTAYLTGTPPVGTTAPASLRVEVTYVAAPVQIPQCVFIQGDQLVANNNFTIQMTPYPEFTSADTIFGLTGTQNSFAITTNQPAGAISSSGGMPPGISLRNNGNGTADLSGTPQAGYGGYYPLTLRIDNAGSVGEQLLEWHMLEAPKIPVQDAVLFHAGMMNKFYVDTTGYPKTPVRDIPSQWGDGMRLTVSGALPAGVTFNSKTPSGVNSGVGLFSGMPAAGSEGMYPLTITAINGAPPTATRMFTLIVAKMGDVNGDTAVNCSDVAVVRAAMGTRRGYASYVFRADVNNDGVVDLKDVALVSSRLTPGTRCQ